jgi:hypothetical protein
MKNPIFKYTAEERKKYGVYAKFQAQKEFNTVHTTEVVTREPADNFFVERLANGIKTNVPVLAVLHSPGGFEFGYGGSGPADLALNILLYVTQNLPYAIYYHQQFKYEFIVPIEGEAGIIYYQEVLEFLKNSPVEAIETVGV